MLNSAAIIRWLALMPAFCLSWLVAGFNLLCGEPCSAS